MPSGAGPGGVFLFSTVGRNRFDVAASAAGSAWLADGLGRVAVKATIAAAAIVTTATHAHALLLRRGTDTVLIGFERRLLICLLVELLECAGFQFPRRTRSRTALRTHGPPDRPRNTAGPAVNSAILQGEFVEPAGPRVGAQAVPVAQCGGRNLIHRLRRTISPSCPKRQHPRVEDCERDAGAFLPRCRRAWERRTTRGDTRKTTRWQRLGLRCAPRL